MNRDSTRAACPIGVAPFRTVGATTAWSAEEAEQILAFLDALRGDIWNRYGEDIARAHHEQRCHDAQHALDFDDPPF